MQCYTMYIIRRIIFKSTIVSIPKEKSVSLSYSNNYRGISLFNCINRLYEYVLIDLCGDQLVISDMQFAYKPYRSILVCVLLSSRKLLKS